MRGEPVVGVRPELLRWGRTTVGLSTADVATMLKRTQEEIEAWESGADAPTYPQLEKLAYEIYKRPLAIFFLPVPPEESPPQSEFRTLPDADMRTLSRDTYLHIRRAHAFQIALRELFDSRNPVERRIWQSVTLAIQQDVVAQAETVRTFLGISVARQIEWSSDEQALKEWRKAVEDVGVFVFKASFKQKEISGFCLVDEQLPVIYLNNGTSKTRQIFSLLHELAHLLLRVNGLSKFETEYVARLPRQEMQIERFCNAIAAEILIPGADFSAQIAKLPANAERVSDNQFSALAERYGVSREAILRRFLDRGMVEQNFYETKAAVWAAQAKKAGGGNWYLNQGAYLSDRFAKEVVSRHYRNQITLEQAADYLGIKPKTFAGLEGRLLEGAGA